MITDDVDFLAALLAREYPEPVDEFEDLLADRLGVYRHPHLEYGLWRILRVRAITAAGARADEFAVEIEALLG